MKVTTDLFLAENQVLKRNQDEDKVQMRTEAVRRVFSDIWRESQNGAGSRFNYKQRGARATCGRENRAARPLGVLRQPTSGPRTEQQREKRRLTAATGEQRPAAYLHQFTQGGTGQQGPGVTWARVRK